MNECLKPGNVVKPSVDGVIVLVLATWPGHHSFRGLVLAPADPYGYRRVGDVVDDFSAKSIVWMPVSTDAER